MEDLTKKMVFLSGPRQVGKTTLAKTIMQQLHGRYLLYDDPEDRNTILKRTFTKEGVVCLDEFHKHSRWKDYLKGLFDKHREHLQILVTGSARLDIYQQSGDSLFGRFFLHYLHPLSLAELHRIPVALPTDILSAHRPLDGLDDLFRFSGFPEPFLAAKDADLRRWSNQRRELLIREDLSQLTQIQLLGVAENLMTLLPDRIGSLFSYAALAEDLQVATRTVQHWLYDFERLYIVFKITPYSKTVARAIRKRPKYYLWNWTDITEDGPRFENLVASHLFKATQTWTSLGLANAQLHFVSDRTQREVDFLITKEGKPWFLVEAKLTDSAPAASLLFFAQKWNIPWIQLVKKTAIFKRFEGGIVCSADQWLGNLV
jgi:predicted AAA+ superfamily ATPase